MQVRISGQNQERIETVQNYFKSLSPVSVELGHADVVSMALRELAETIERSGFADEGIEAARVAQESLEEE